MEAYCFKCKEKREIMQPTAGFTSRGAAMTTGVCGVCGTGLFRMGATPAHEGLEKPVYVKPEKPATAARKSLAKSKTTVIKSPASKKTAKKSSTSGRQSTNIRKAGTGRPLVIVESPSKARTIGRYLGDKYKVVASVGHVRDLLKSQLSIDVENDFVPKYRVPNEKKAVVREIRELAAQSNAVYLATDPDREGEAIAWHLMDSAEIDPAKAERVVFNEITRNAVAEAFEHPRQIDMDLVDAQQARRILDRLVGYNISPILWAKVRGRLSAGRVQSVAVRLVVEREREIQDFIPQEYWIISALFQPEGGKEIYKARLMKINGSDPVLDNEGVTNAHADDMRRAVYTLESIKTSTRKQRPYAPFITSTLQQEASKRLNFLTRKTMAVAQQLYEGINVGNGDETGLITYMRTDSVHLAPQAVTEARDYIKSKYGKEYLPEKQPVYKTRAASAQEAHEAIRPTSVLREPDTIKHYLTNDQYRLYKLVWQRFVASQMENALIETTSVDVVGKHAENKYLLRATGSRQLFAGFKVVYQDTKEEIEKQKEDQVNLPMADLREGQTQILKDLECTQHFTQPPARYTEASLIQVLEENKIGRPSTYSPIITNIQARGYVSREQKQLYPTEVGFLVNDLVVEYFPEVVDISFTSAMEDQLDEIAEGKEPWVEVIREFYGPFEKRLENAREHMPKQKLAPEKVGRLCPVDGGELVFRTGKFGKFISCANFPSCRYTEPWLEKIGVKCPTCKTGDVVEKRTRKGRLFYGCSRYPECDFTSWNKPLTTPCPNCKGTLVASNKTRATCLECKNVYTLQDGEVREK